MSGLLHRLAAHALGQTGRIHSAAHLPYSEPTPFAEPMTDVDGSADGLPQQQNDAPGHNADAPSPSAAPKQRPEMPAPDAEHTTSPATTAAPRMMSMTQSIQRIPQALMAPRTGAGLVGDKTAATLAGLPPESDGRQAEDIAGEFLDEATPQALARHQRSLPEARRPPHPTPLLKSVAANAPRGPRLAPPVAAVAGRVEETTEVHVSIGRIEVTEVHEAAPPRRPAPRAAKPTSLDEYLARRGAAR